MCIQFLKLIDNLLIRKQKILYVYWLHKSVTFEIVIRRKPLLTKDEAEVDSFCHGQCYPYVQAIFISLYRMLIRYINFLYYLFSKWYCFFSKCFWGYSQSDSTFYMKVWYIFMLHLHVMQHDFSLFNSHSPTARCQGTTTREIREGVTYESGIYLSTEKPDHIQNPPPSLKTRAGSSSHMWPNTCFLWFGDHWTW